MTPAVLDRPAPPFAERCGEGAEQRGHGRTAAGERIGGGRVTLEERLNGALREARTSGSTECPVCQARMSFGRAGGGHAAACGGCGTELS